jgi:hypothetical protein
MELRANPASSQIMQGITESLARQVPKKKKEERRNWMNYDTPRFASTGLLVL